MSLPSVQTLLGVVEESKPDRRLVARPMFKNEVADGETFSFDKISRNKGLAKFRDPEGDAGVVKTLSSERITATLHTLKDKKSLSKRLLRLMQAPGGMKKQKFQERLVMEMEDLQDLHERTWEKLCWDLLRTGITTTTDETGVTNVYDYGMSGIATAANLWSVTADATPLSDLVAARNAVRRAWGEEAVEMYISSAALRMAMNATDTRERLDPSTLDAYSRDGVIDKLSKLGIHVVDSGYTPDGGDFTPYLSSDSVKENVVIIKAGGHIGEFAEGTPVDGDAPENHTGRFVKIFKDNSDSKIPQFLQEHFAIPGMTMPNKVYALTVY